MRPVLPIAHALWIALWMNGIRGSVACRGWVLGSCHGLGDGQLRRPAGRRAVRRDRSAGRPAGPGVLVDRPGPGRGAAGHRPAGRPGRGGPVHDHTGCRIPRGGRELAGRDHRPVGGGTVPVPGFSRGGPGRQGGPRTGRAGPGRRQGGGGRGSASRCRPAVCWPPSGGSWNRWIEPDAGEAVLAGLVAMGVVDGSAGVRRLRPALLARTGSGSGCKTSRTGTPG